MKGVNIRKYDNGFELRYIREPLNTVKGALVIQVGAGYEKPEEYGLSHFVEHTVFRGGTTRLLPEECDRITSTLGYANAFTSVRETSYEGHFLPENLGLFLKFISDVTMDAQFRSEIVDEERRAIIAEREGGRNNPSALATEAFFNFVYQVSPARRNSIAILGPPENIIRIGQDALKRYHKRWTNRANMTLYLMGPLPDNIEESIGEFFGQPDQPFEPFVYQQEPPLEGIRRGGIKRKGAERTSMSIAWHVPPEERYREALDIRGMKQIMAGDFSSGLLKELRIDKGLVYSVSVAYISNFGQGLCAVETNVKPGKEDLVEEAVLGSVRKLQRGEIDAGFFEREKKRAAFQTATNADSPNARFKLIGVEKKTGHDPMAEIDLILKTKPEDIQRASHFLDTDKYILFTESPE